MTWNSVSPLVHLVEGTYSKQMLVPNRELNAFEQHWQRSEILPKWDISIYPA